MCIYVEHQTCYYLYKVKRFLSFIYFVTRCFPQCFNNVIKEDAILLKYYVHFVSNETYFAMLFNDT